MQDVQPQSAHPSYNLQRGSPVTEKSSLTQLSSPILQARSVHRQNRASQSHTSTARGDVQVERRTGNTSGPHYSAHGVQATVLIPSPPASPKDKGQESHAYYSREGEPQTADDIEGRADLNGSGWFWLADSCCNDPQDKPKAQLPTGNFRYLREVILSAV